MLLAAPAVNPKAHAMDDMSALHFATQNGHTEVARMLITAGIPVNGKTRKHVTPLHLACQKGAFHTLYLLIWKPSTCEPLKLHSRQTVQRIAV